MTISDVEKSKSEAKNSTNGHAVLLPIPAIAYWPFRAASLISPKLGGEIGRQIFFRPPRPRYQGEQRAILGQAEKSTLQVRDETIAAYEWGDGPSRVLLVHGWGGHAGHMTELVAPLLDAGHRVVAIEAHGHGSSGGRLSSLVHFSECIHAAARHFGAFDGLIAHSIGCAGSVLALRRGLAVKRAVFFAPQAQFYDYWQLFRDSMNMPDEVWQHMTDKSERWLNIRFADIHPAAHAPHMTTPLLVLHGTADRVSLPHNGEDLAKLWPYAQLRMLDTGHLSILREPDAILAATGFITRK